MLFRSKWLEFAFGLMSALKAVHSVGVVHRDIKPSNILMSASGPKVIDFGISYSSDATSLTRTGMVAGTPAWFSPEQFEGTKITSAVDNFAAGSVLYFAATGKNPWGKEDTSVANTMNMILNKDADMSNLTDRQKEVISLLHKKSPKERSTAEEILGRLQVIEEDLGINIKKDQKILGIPSKFAKMAAVSAAVAIAGASFYFYQGNTSKGDTGSKIASPKPVETIQWTLEVVGDPKPQKEIGRAHV